MALVVAIVLTTAMALGTVAALADGDSGSGTSTPSITIVAQSNSGTASSDTTSYTWYRILEAEIGEDPTQSGTSQSGGKVAYYVDSQDKAAELEKTNLFNISRVGDTNKWYVELKVESTSAQSIINALSDENFDLSKFASDTFAQTTPGGTASSGKVAPGYYYVTSTLGTKAVLQTLTAVTINEKNEYVTDDKTIPSDDKNAQIGQEITYTLTVNVPATANDEIVLTDTMSKGLTFKEVKSQKIGTTDMTEAQKGTVSEVTSAADEATKFTITYSADQVKALVADDSAKTINIEVVVVVNGDAAIDTDIPNTLDLKYGNNYEAKPVTVNTKTTKVDFNKIDGSNDLPGAEFKLTKNASDTKDSTSGILLSAPGLYSRRHGCSISSPGYSHVRQRTPRRRPGRYVFQKSSTPLHSDAPSRTSACTHPSRTSGAARSQSASGRSGSPSHTADRSGSRIWQ